MESKVQNKSSAGLPFVIALLLTVLTALLFAQTWQNDFVNFDDPDYVTQNGHVQNGITSYEIKWAFTTFHAGNWHPLTWISHMADYQLWRLKASGHHVTNAVIHACNTFLLWLLLRRLTGAAWRSLIVAALFALHPLRVESVAWIAERKDVLSAFFGLLSLIFYARYIGADGEQEEASSTIPAGHYLLSLFFFVLGLLSKPMLVTLPFVMVLLDFWPLKRFEHTRRKRSALSELKAILWEKVPFIFLAIGSCIVTLRAQGEAVAGLELSIWQRLASAVVGYALYLGKIFWPSQLAVFYPHPGSWPIGWVLLGTVLVLGVSALAIWARRQEPFLFTGWFWFLGTLIPVIGLVQVGGQSMADRYTYFPSIGLAMALVWGLHAWTSSRPVLKTALHLITVLVLAACSILTVRQIAVWRNSQTLFQHALAVTGKNFLAENNLGTFFLSQGKCIEAENHLRSAVGMRPDYHDAWNNLGLALFCQKKNEEAKEALTRAIGLRSDLANPYNNFGLVLEAENKSAEALDHFKKAVALDPRHSDAHYNAGRILVREKNLLEAKHHFELATAFAPGRFKPQYHFAHGHVLVGLNRMAEAVLAFRAAIELFPDYPEAHNNLANALSTLGRKDEALREYAEAIRLNPHHAGAHYNLGDLLLEFGQVDEAIMRYESALVIDPEFAPAKASRALAYVKKGWVADALNELEAVLKSHPDLAEAHYAQGLALKANLQFAEAKKELEQALKLNPGFSEAKEALAELERFK